MTDIFQEVEEDMRRERLKTLWDRYGIYVILTAVLIVAVTAGWRGYEAWSTSRARAAGDAFIEKLQAAEDAGTASVGTELLEFADDAPSGYALLARFRAATAFASAGEPADAERVLGEIAEDGGVEEVYRDLARVRLANIQIEEGEFEAVPATLGAIAEDTSNPYSSAAQELMGLAAYASDDLATARRWFVALSEGVGVPPDLADRARIMLALITQTEGEVGPDGGAEASETGAGTASGEATTAASENKDAQEETN